jgi:hypothetical protein
MTAIGNHNKIHYLNEAPNTKATIKQTQSHQRIRPQTGIQYSRQGLQSAKLLKKHIANEDINEEDQASPQIEIKNILEAKIIEKGDLRIRTRVNKVLRNRINHHYISKLRSEPENQLSNLPVPELLLEDLHYPV